MRTIKAEGIVIKRRNFGEADRMLTIFTRYLGKISVKAAGIRRIPSRRSPHVELLNHSALTLYRGASLYILTEAQTIKNFSPLKEDLTKVGFAYHICELIDGFCPENQENQQVFYLMQNVLSQLIIENDLLLVLHDFEIELLSLLGYWHKKREDSKRLNTQAFIENILERKLKSRDIFEKLS